MFKEGRCPRCHEKIQVPEEREKIICMFCGEEISVDEALGRKSERIKITPKEYEEHSKEAKDALEEVIRSCDNPMSDFKRDKYEGVFEEYYAGYRKMFEAMELVYTNTDDSTECIQKFVGYLVHTTREELGNIKFKSRRTQKQMDYNFLISVYLIPTALKYPATFSEPFADCLVETWNREFQTSIGKARYDDIAKGFRRKLCYITTAVCESLGKEPDCYELSVLKHYRDEMLEPTPEGHALVEEYYNIAPTIVKRMEKQPECDKLYRELYQNYLMPCVRDIENQEYEACQARYQDMVLELKKQYLS